jgi:hypothetical protein
MIFTPIILFLLTAPAEQNLPFNVFKADFPTHAEAQIEGEAIAKVFSRVGSASPLTLRERARELRRQISQVIPAEHTDLWKFYIAEQADYLWLRHSSGKMFNDYVTKNTFNDIADRIRKDGSHQ